MKLLKIILMEDKIGESKLAFKGFKQKSLRREG